MLEEDKTTRFISAFLQASKSFTEASRFVSQHSTGSSMHQGVLPIAAQWKTTSMFARKSIQVRSRGKRK
jgi:hypothetical protein